MFRTLAIAAVLAATAFATVPAQAAGYTVGDSARTFGYPAWDRLFVRAWPAAHSRKLGGIKRGRTVWVERCIIKSGTDWCKVSSGGLYGWVNGRFIRTGGHTFAAPHPWYGY